MTAREPSSRIAAAAISLTPRAISASTRGIICSTIARTVAIAPAGTLGGHPPAARYPFKTLRRCEIRHGRIRPVFDRTGRRSRLADDRVGRLPLRRHLGQDRRPEAAADTRIMCRNMRPKSAGYWGMEADFVSFLARNRCKPPVTQSQFQTWARALGVPIAAYNNRAWLTRIPDVATQLIFGGSPGPSTETGR